MQGLQAHQEAGLVHGTRCMVPRERVKEKGRGSEREREREGERGMKREKIKRGLPVGSSWWRDSRTPGAWMERMRVTLARDCTTGWFNVTGGQWPGSVAQPPLDAPRGGYTPARRCLCLRCRGTARTRLMLQPRIRPRSSATPWKGYWKREREREKEETTLPRARRERGATPASQPNAREAGSASIP